MTAKRKAGNDPDLATILGEHMALADLQEDIEWIMASPSVSDQDRHIIAAAIHPPVSFGDAVEAIATSPLMEAMRGLGPELMTKGGENPTALDQATVLELCELGHPGTRESADVSRLIEASESDRAAYDACLQLWQIDQRRPGMPNWQLRQWGVSKPKAPRRKAGVPELPWRGAALTILIRDAAVLGFLPYKNAATDDPKRSACDVVAAALLKAGLGTAMGPSSDTLEQIWKKNRHRVEPS